ncbi:MAG: aminopeptidase [Opitutales bacterium]|nr:aminopeptidase [Opitutales bacterium]
MDFRYKELADVLTGFSTRLSNGDKVLIDAFDVPAEIVVALIRAARERGALPFARTTNARVNREMLMQYDAEMAEANAALELERMKGMQAYIALRGADNIFESSDVPAENMRDYMRVNRPVQNWRVGKTRWVVLRWPTSAMAQQAQMSTEAFEDFYFDVCTMDYARMRPGMAALKERTDKANRVEILGPGTELRFSIEGLKGIPCGGKRNIPDGEVYTAPVKDSVEGVITYNAPTVYQGEGFEKVRLEFSKGRIIKATCSGNDEKLNRILDSDEGARYVGEFAIGFNPYILKPMRDILFDEKIAGSFHFTPGQAYEGPADNGNRSQVHWDLVNIQRPDWGGGEIRFDGELIRKDGLFVNDAGLELLNPDFLLSKAPYKEVPDDGSSDW